MAEGESGGREEPSVASPATGGGMAQVDPDGAARYHEADTRRMLNDLSGEVSILRDRLARIDSRAEADSRRLDDLSRKSDTLLGQVAGLTPKIEDIAGFIKHGVAALAKKDDLTAIKLDIEKRPTRRQSIVDLIAFIGLVGGVVALAAHFLK